MDFDKTSFQVDWFTPGDKYGPKRLSFPKSACISVDDFVSDSPLSYCFSKLPAMSCVDNTFKKPCGFVCSGPPSPLAVLLRESYRMDEQQPTTTGEENPTDSHVLPSPGLVSIADACASCGVELDASCLNALDEHLLNSPVQCFIELCWAAAVCDDASAPPTTRRKYSARAHSFKAGRERIAIPPLERVYPWSFECERPLATKPSSPLSKHPRSAPLPCSPTSKSHAMSPPICQDVDVPVTFVLQDRRRLGISSEGVQKRTLTATPSVESFLSSSSPPQSPRLQTSRSSTTLRILSDACMALARPRKKSPLSSP